tara:strand:- start:20289 stop:20507 length:219 start_codon:yes stop_codon:yes gene_type:complete
MSNITLNVEFLAGTDFTEAVEEAKQKCQQWDVALVCFKFNGVECSVSRNADAENLHKRYMKALGSDKKYIIG